jgi:hypothetical protein
MTAQLLDSLRREKEIDKTTPWLALPGTSADDCCSLSRNDIDFLSVGDRVCIEIRITNRSERRSAPGCVVLTAAPFGAFVPWQPLVSLPLPALAPGKAVYLRSGAVPWRPEPLGSPDRVPPRKLLTALGLADDPPGEPAPAKRSAAHQPAAPIMPADLMELLIQETPHWVGNLNVHVGNKDVERHLARALRVYPGRVNMAWFIVGSGSRDAYAFRLHGLGKDWDVKLFDMTTRESLILNPAETPGLPPQQWIPSEGSRTMLMAMRVPKNCPAGAVEVHVTQRSTARTAVVEFSLDARAAGRGCYVV